MIIEHVNKNYKIILASKSPRRRELIADAGFRFSQAEDYDLEEVYPDTLHPHDVAAYLSKLKSEAYPVELTQNQILITADTTVCLDDMVLGKPSDRGDAVRILRLLSGNKHEVVTAVTLRDRTKTVTFSASTSVWFRELSDAEIHYYIDNYKPYDKAGAYGIQEWIGYVGIERIEGSFYNVMGLPIQQLYQEITKFVR